MSSTYFSCFQKKKINTRRFSGSNGTEWLDTGDTQLLRRSNFLFLLLSSPPTPRPLFCCCLNLYGEHVSGSICVCVCVCLQVAVVVGFFRSSFLPGRHQRSHIWRSIKFKRRRNIASLHQPDGSTGKKLPTDILLHFSQIPFLSFFLSFLSFSEIVKKPDRGASN